MFARLRAALGLRGRIVGAVLFTTVATLGVAAAALLGPLEHQLRNQTLNTLVDDLRHRDATAGFTGLDLRFAFASADLDPADQAIRDAERVALQQQEQRLRAALGASVTLFAFGGTGTAQRVPTSEPASDEDAVSADVLRAFSTRNVVKSFGFSDGSDLARAAVPLRIQGRRYVLAVRRPITEVAGAVHVVRVAFLDAALVGMLLTLLLGIPLSGRLVRRLRNLREAAARVTQEGLSADVPVDRARDEVGDLSRALAVMQRRLRNQEEARRSFVSTASHELRTPLTSLEGMLELLAEELADELPDLADARSLLVRARAQSHRLGQLAADLLDLSRIDAQVQLRSEPVELAELCRAVLAEFERAASERQVTLVLDEAPEPVWALGDPGSVARILRILVDNALRVSPPGSSLSVALRGGEAAVLSVADQGPGVEPDERELIFQRFHRGRQTGGAAGFGLGLAIGRELAERMDGRLELDTAAELGARFTLRLPVAVAPLGEPLAI